MLFCVKVANQTLASMPDVHKSAPAAEIRPDAAAPSKIDHSGKITLGGGCRLPLQGAPMQRDRTPRFSRNKPE